MCSSKGSGFTRGGSCNSVRGRGIIPYLKFIEIPTLATASRRLLSPKGTGDWPVSFCAEVTLFGQGTQALRDAAGSFVLGGILCKWCHISMIIDAYFVVFFCLTVGHLAAAEVVGSCDLPAEAGYLVCNCVQL